MKLAHGLVLLGCAASATAGDLPLLPAPMLLTPDDVRDVELADLDGDGIGDLLAAETVLFSSSSLTVRPGLGAGRFGASQVLVTTATTGVDLGQQIATVDLDGDADLDVIYTGAVGATLYVLRNDGGFRFTTSTMLLGNELRCAAAGDVNGDGLQDVVIASYATNTIAVLLGDGAGGLQTSVVTSTGTHPTSLVLADLNNDGWLDIATANEFDGEVGVLLGLGGGTFGGFGTAAQYFVCGSVSSIAAADLNGDGYRELIAGCANAGLKVLFNNGSGLFGAPNNVPAAALLQVTEILPADLDGDGKRDLVLGARNGITRVLFGTGTGGFHTTANSNYAIPDAWDRVALGQLGGDTLPDVVVARNKAIVAFTGLGAALDVPATLPVPGNLIELGDVTGDGKPDVIGSDSALKAITVRLGNGTDALDASPSATVKTVVGSGSQVLTHLDAADLDVDGDVDPVAVIGNVAQPTLAQPDGSLLLPTWIPLGAFPSSMRLFELDGDGLPDMVSGNASNQVRVYRGLGNGEFVLKQSVSPPNAAGDFAAGDFDADGNLDLTVTNGFGGVALLPGLGDATFASPVALLSGVPVTEVELSDLDADGYADLLTTSASDLRVSLHGGDGALLPPVLYANGDGELRLGDVDGDGLQDAITSSAAGLVGVYHANGDGTLEAGQFFGNDSALFGVGGSQLAVGDLNTDGDADVLVVSVASLNSTLQVMPSRLQPTVTTLGGALAGAAGDPQLAGAGTLLPLTPLALHITQAAPVAPTSLILGFTELNLPIKGGVLVPSPDVQVHGLLTNAGGALLLNVSWPAGVPSGISIWGQAWIVDAGGPKGLAATNALRLDVP